MDSAKLIKAAGKLKCNLLLSLTDRNMLQCHNWLDGEKIISFKTKKMRLKNLLTAKELKGGDGGKLNKSTK